MDTKASGLSSVRMKDNVLWWIGKHQKKVFRKCICPDFSYCHLKKLLSYFWTLICKYVGTADMHLTPVSKVVGDMNIHQLSLQQSQYLIIITTPRGSETILLLSWQGRALIYIITRFFVVLSINSWGPTVRNKYGYTLRKGLRTCHEECWQGVSEVTLYSLLDMCLKGFLLGILIQYVQKGCFRGS